MRKLLIVELFKIIRAKWFYIFFVLIILVMSLFYLNRYNNQINYYQDQERKLAKEAKNIEVLFDLARYDTSIINSEQEAFLKNYILLLSNYKITSDQKNKINLLYEINVMRLTGYNLSLSVFTDSLTQTIYNIALHEHLLTSSNEPLIIDNSIALLPLFVSFHHDNYHLLIIIIILIIFLLILSENDSDAFKILFIQPVSRKQILLTKYSLGIIISYGLYFIAFISLLFLSNKSSFINSGYPYLIQPSTLIITIESATFSLIISDLSLTLLLLAIITTTYYLTFSTTVSSIIALCALILVNNINKFNFSHFGNTYIMTLVLVLIALMLLVMTQFAIKKRDLN
ncbi:MAG: ABC transporter permease subunit [Erysipelotrichaceae bacterium]|nr:ABC transporter permease subunit [Erysipelotrichaceae bacterium]